MAQFIIEASRLQNRTSKSVLISNWMKVFVSTGFYYAAVYQHHFYCVAVGILVIFSILISFLRIVKSKPEWIAFALKARGFGLQGYYSIATTTYSLLILRWHFLTGALVCVVSIGITMRIIGHQKIRLMPEQEYQEFSNLAYAALNAQVRD